MEKQNRNRLIDTENIPDGYQKGKGIGGLGEKGEGIKKYKLVVKK